MTPPANPASAPDAAAAPDATRSPDARRPTDTQTAAELAQVQAEPLLPIEKRLIIGSITLGLVLLAILYWVSQTYLEK